MQANWITCCVKPQHSRLAVTDYRCGGDVLPVQNTDTLDIHVQEMCSVPTVSPKRYSVNRVCVSLLMSSILCLAGCEVSKGNVSSTPETSTLGQLQGGVRGGQQPVVGAHVYLYAAGTTGTAGKDIPASTGNASVSLLTISGSNVQSDGTNYYVTTDANGYFSITGDYTCTSGTQLYLYVIGGNPGAGANSADGFLSGVGACPSGLSTLPASDFFLINEVTTVATAYALAGYASDALHISANTSVSGSPAAELAATGIANAMANVNNLVNISTGAALSNTPAGNGSVPQPEINTLANILATCINSSNAVTTSCTNLFNAALSDGTSGSAPTDTATAAINIAHNAAQNVATLYGLQQGIAAPFMPDLSVQPNDFSIQIAFGGGGTASPRSIAIDASGNVWGASAGDIVNWYSPLGVPLAASGLTTSTTNKLSSLTIDPDGNIWAQDVAGTYTEFSSTGSQLSPSGGYSGGNNGSSALTTDSFGYLWSTNSSDGTVYRFDPIAQTSVANYTIGTSSLIAADSAGFVWIGGSGGTLYKLNQTGATVATYSSLYTDAAAMVIDSTNAAYVDNSSTQLVMKIGSDGTRSSFLDGAGGAQALAVDGANNIWSAKNMVSEHSSSGANLSGSGFLLPSGTVTTSIAVDDSGNLWAADTSENNGQAGTHYTEFIGAAAPELTPTSYVTTHGTLQNAQNLTIGFNGPDIQFPYADQFYAAQGTYYQSMGSSYPAGGRYCHAYLSWDIAEQAEGTGPVGTEGSRAWFEDWLANAQGNCDRALVTFKYIAGITTNDTGTYPSVSDYEAGITEFLNTDWSYTGWAGAFDYTPWNEPQNGGASGDGLTVQIPVETDADYYLALRKHCAPPGCTVAAGDFGSNGSLDTTFVQNCASDLVLCSGGSYMDKYKYWIVEDAPTYGFTSTFRPEVFAYHGWDDINNYINSSSHCTNPQTCTIRALVTSLTDGAWTNAIIWDTEVAAGQDPESNPTPVVQACAASYLLNLTGSVSNRITRIYWTQPYVAAGNYFSMFDSNGNPKPSFYVMADRNISYTPPAGSTCP